MRILLAFLTAVWAIRRHLIALAGIGVVVWWFDLDRLKTYTVTVLVSAADHMVPEMQRQMRRLARARRLRTAAAERDAAQNDAARSSAARGSAGRPPLVGQSSSQPRASEPPRLSDPAPASIGSTRAPKWLPAALGAGVLIWLLATFFSLWIFRMPG